MIAVPYVVRTLLTSVSDSNPDSIRSVDPDPDSDGPKWPTKVEKIKKFHVLKRWMLSFEG
jgi:hypothetical protein